MELQRGETGQLFLKATMVVEEKTNLATLLGDEKEINARKSGKTPRHEENLIKEKSVVWWRWRECGRLWARIALVFCKENVAIEK